MSNPWIKYTLFFIFLVFFQGLVVQNVNLSLYFNPMVYPLLIMILPFEFGVLATLAIALVLGLSVDAFSNGFGLHASATLLIAYMRPMILRIIRPRDGYNNLLTPTIYDMGPIWFMSYASITLAIHHFWYFAIEMFRLDHFFFLLSKTISSVLFSLILIFLIQYIFYRAPKK